MPALLDATPLPRPAAPPPPAPPPRVACLTLCYPDADHPTRGLFVQRRLAAISPYADLHVLCPRPWFPLLRPRRARGIAVARPEGAVPASAAALRPPRDVPMFYLPRLAKSADAAWFARAARRALRDLQSETPLDLVDAHFEWPDGVGAWRAARQLDLPVVVTLRGKLVSAARHALRRRPLADMLRDADGLIAVSVALARLARQIARRDLEIDIIPNGVDPAQFHPLPRDAARRQLGWSPAATWLVAVGHLQALKGWDLLIDALPAIRREAGDVRLALVGGSAGEPAFERRLRRQIAAHGLRNAIQLAGALAPLLVNVALNAADLFVLPSRSEGCCNALLEAQAAGCPAVASDVGGNAEILLDPAAGRLVRPDDPAALADGVCQALATRWDRPRIARSGAQRSWQQVAAQTLAAWECARRRHVNKSRGRP
ncbi:MAG: glycosyltransferase [Phycisphaerae bacterium]